MPRQNNASIPNRRIQAVVKHSEKARVSKESLLQLAGIAPDLLNQPNARIPAPQFVRLTAHTMHALNDEFLGYGKSPYLPGTWRNMCQATVHTQSLGHAIARYCRFYQMFDSDICPFVEDNGEHTKVIFKASDPNYRYDHYAWELQLFNLHRYLSWLADQHLAITEVALPYPKPIHHDEYQQLFLGYPVVFDHTECALTFKSSLTELAISKTEHELKRMLRHPNLVLLAQQYSVRSLTSQVRQQLSLNLLAMPSLEDIAASISLHPQTLSRRLASEGTSYNKIKLQCRRDSALYYLSRSTLPVEKIALKVGFSETSAFTRAFKTWTGVPPQAYRQSR